MQKLNENVATRDTPAAERKRIPMSVPVRKLEVPEIPGFHLHWFVSTPQRLQRALDGGYTFVDEREMKLLNTSIGGVSTHSGNQDLGSQVSVVSGTNEEGQTERMILMKIPQAWYEEDQKLVEARNQSVADSLNSGTTGQAGAADKHEAGFRYIDKSRTKIPDMFRNKKNDPVKKA